MVSVVGALERHGLQERVAWLIRRVRAADGTDVAVQADTICLHGDGPHAVAFARRLRAELQATGIELTMRGA